MTFWALTFFLVVLPLLAELVAAAIGGFL